MAQLGIPVLGQIPRTESIFVPSRHLGLVPAGEWEDSATKVAGLGGLIAEYVDLDAVMDMAATAPDLDVEPW
ncbi:cobyrinic acid a,c-diamide synthase, partial [Rhizobium leguminosarum]